MASISPTAKNDQFPLSTTSPLLKLMPLRGDSLPRAHSLTRSVSDKEILRAKSNAGCANSDRGLAESLLHMDDKAN